MTRTLLLLRHATTEDARPGGRDADRRLTPEGEQQARALGAWLRGLFRPDVVLCSTAVRARETLAALGIDAPADFPEELYDAGGDTIVDIVRAIDADARTALVVGHAPAIPAVVHDLADPDTSDPAALQIIESRFPAGTLAALDFDGAWAELTSAALTAVRLPMPQ